MNLFFCIKHYKVDQLDKIHGKKAKLMTRGTEYITQEKGLNT